MFSRQKVIAIIVILVTITVPSAVSAAHVGATIECSGDYQGVWPDVGFGNNALASIYAQREGGRSQRTILADIPAGTFQVTAVSYDGYDERTYTEPLQELEQYFLQFLDVDGNVLASTGATGDLLDGVEEDTQSFAVGEVTLSAPATEVRAVHLYAGQAVGTQSVMPSCFGAVVTTPTTTTAAVTSTTTTAAVTSTTTTAATPVTAPPSTVPLQVLPEVQVAESADPVNAVPSFTG